MKKVTVQKKCNDIINRLNRTKKELVPNFAALREEYDAEVGRHAMTASKMYGNQAADASVPTCCAGEEGKED